VPHAIKIISVEQRDARVQRGVQGRKSDMPIKPKPMADTLGYRYRAVEFSYHTSIFEAAPNRLTDSGGEKHSANRIALL
jgi:hypothetical protein